MIFLLMLAALEFGETTGMIDEAEHELFQILDELYAGSY